MKPSTPKISDREQSDSPSEETSQNVPESSELENRSLSQEIEVTEINSISPRRARSQITVRDEQVISSENIKIAEKNEHRFSRFAQKFPIILLGFHERPRLQFKNNKDDAQSSRQIPPPPSYYPSRPITGSYAIGHGASFNLIQFNPHFWCPYPTTIPRNTPANLAQLVDVDTLFVIKNFELLNFVANIDLPNTYLIQNNKGECIYYATEIYNYFTRCVGRERGMKFIFRDVYDNDVIFMNKYYGCTCPCTVCCHPVVPAATWISLRITKPYWEEKFCAPNVFEPRNVRVKVCLNQEVMEVYAPPANPLGAIFRVCQSPRNDFSIVDANENEIFYIRGSILGNICGTFSTLEYTIHSVDRHKTLVGRIKRQTMDFSTYYFNSEIYGVSFLSNLDVRIKTILLGALLLISLKRTGWVLRNVEDPETVSGHMYRMSIMTFLIPESSEVDKARCMKLSLVHDLAECIVGDLTPFCGVDASEKHRQEEVAMKELTQMIGDSGDEIYKLYKEYEAQVTNESKFVKDLDRLDMILQAFEYEKLGDKPGQLEEFFTSTINKFNFPWSIDIVKEIYKQRNLFISKEKCSGKIKF